MEINDNTRLAIVVQGPSIYVPEIKESWKDFKKDIIFSTWIGDEDKYEKDDLVIFNEKPYEGLYNFNLQKKSTYVGLLKAKELGYTHVIKVRSDYLPTNAKKLVSILEADKINLLNWQYTEYLWLRFPELKGYITDHFMTGPIDYMIELWDIPINFTSAQIMITWSYIRKLSHKIKINYLLPYLSQDNDLFYIKESGTPDYFFEKYLTRFNDKELIGRYESVFQTFRKDENSGYSEYLMTPEKTEQFFNWHYLDFMMHFHPLPYITIFNNKNINIDLENMVYPSNKLQITNNKDDINGEYVIKAENIIDSETIIIQLFKKMNILYDDIKNNITYTYQIKEYVSKNDKTFKFLYDERQSWIKPGNFKDSSYTKSVECFTSDILLTTDEFRWNPLKNMVPVDLDFIQFGIDENELYINKGTGIITEAVKFRFDKLLLDNNILKLNCAVTGENVVNNKIKVFYIPDEIINMKGLDNKFKCVSSIYSYHQDYLKDDLLNMVKSQWVNLYDIKTILRNYNIRKINKFIINSGYEDLSLINIIYELISNSNLENHPNEIRLITQDFNYLLENNNVANPFINLGYSVFYNDKNTVLKK